MNQKLVEVEIKKQEYPNVSLGFSESLDMPVEFKGGVLGQKCLVKVKRKNGEKYKGKFIDLLSNSPLENEKNPCPNSDICGGCSYQKFGYETELMIKRQMVLDLLNEASFSLAEIKINRSPKVKGYRNKMEYTFGDSFKLGPLVLGLHRENFFYDIVDTNDCNIVDRDFELLRRFVENYFRKRNFPYYHKTSHDGILRNLIVRKALNTGEIMVILVTTSSEFFTKEDINNFAIDLLGADLEGRIVSIFHCINDSLADAVKVDDLRLIYGRSYIKENILDLTFKISPFSFFQPNIYTAEKLYQKALEYGGVTKETRVLDLYCGTGTISQIFAQKAKSVLGIEIVEEAVAMAKDNARLNYLTNVSFVAGDVLEEIKKIDGDYDLVVLDPPREGINPNAIGNIIGTNPKRFVYISCNPKTQVRDMEFFRKAGYELKEYEIFDQFPRSRHVECIAMLEK